MSTNPSNNNKKGLTPNDVHNLRSEFRRRSARKNAPGTPSPPPPTTTTPRTKTATGGPKPSTTQLRRKPSKNQISTTSHDKSTYSPDEALSKYHQPTKCSKNVPPAAGGSADKIEEDPPTEFESIPGAKPAIFAPDWHKYDVPLDQLPTGLQPSHQQNGSLKKKTEGKRGSEKKKHIKKLSHGKKPSTISRQDTTTAEDKGCKTYRSDDHNHGSSSSSSSYKRRSGSGSKPRRTTSDTGNNNKKDKRKMAAQLASQYKELKASTSATTLGTTSSSDNHKTGKSKPKLSGEVIEPHHTSNAGTSAEAPLLSLDDDEVEKTTRAKTSSPKLIPVNDMNMKLKPLIMPNTLQSADTPAPDDEITALDIPDDHIEKAPPKLIETDNCGNANFPVVVAAGRIIDYCDEKDLFKEFIEPGDLPTFNAFLTGEVKSMPDLLTILDHLMDQIIDSKKLSEVEAISKDWMLVNRDRVEGRNYLLDHFLSKKAKINVSEQVLTAKKSTSSTSVTSTASSTTTATTTSSFGGSNSSGESFTQTTETTQTQDHDEHHSKDSKGQ